jgi:hypothetical protein
MTSITSSPISIQTSEPSAPLPPPWFGEADTLMLRSPLLTDDVYQREVATMLHPSLSLQSGSRLRYFSISCHVLLDWLVARHRGV